MLHGAALDFQPPKAKFQYRGSVPHSPWDHAAPLGREKMTLVLPAKAAAAGQDPSSGVSAGPVGTVTGGD